MELLRMYCRQVRSLSRLHPEIYSGKMLPPGQKHVGQLELDASIAKDFEKDYAQLADLLRRNSNLTLDYKTMLYCSHIVRWLMLITAVLAPRWAFAVGTLQFLVVPFSFPIAVMFAIVNIPEYAFHYVFAVLLGFTIGGHGPVLTIGYRVSLMFFALDQALSFYVYFRDCKCVELGRILRHLVYGTASTKIVNLIVFALLWGLQMDLAVVFLTSVLSFFFNKYCVTSIQHKFGLPGHDVRFYVQHRIAHLPVVYGHAHKMHHHLHDTCPWDALCFGAGMNEVFFVTVLDFLPCMLAPSMWIFPFCFNLWALWFSFIDKEEHVRSKPGSKGYDAENFHADHHLLHMNNFAVPDGALLDFYFGTQAPKSTGTGGVIFSRGISEDGTKILIDIAMPDVSRKSQ